MPESDTHLYLVSAMVDWVAFQHFNGCRAALLVDLPLTSSANKPPTIGAFRPDLYGQGGRMYSVVVGEAKTAPDLERPHSEQQFLAFLNFCARKESAAFVIAVPWHATRRALAIIRHLKRKHGLDEVATEIIQQLPG